MPRAAKQNDVIIVSPEQTALAGHFVQPSGPVPPVFAPLPFSGLITINVSPDVFIDGLAAATVTSVGRNQPPHIPPPGTTFVVPPMVTNIGTVIAGSPSVTVNGIPLARHGDICTICQDTGPAPLGVVMVVVGTVMVD